MIAAKRSVVSYGKAARWHLAEGRAIYYSDPAYPGQIIREWPDGRRQLVQIDHSNVVTVVFELFD